MDPVADMLTIVKNGYLAGKPEVLIPYSKFKLAIVKVLEKEKFIGKINKKDREIQVQLLYDGHRPHLTHIEKVSKLGLRIYSKSKRITSVKGGRGMIIISTPKGVMTGKEAKLKKLGGEIICKLW